MTGPVLTSTMTRADWLAAAGPWAVRRECGISQVTMAAALGVSQATVSFWETGERRPSGPRGAAYCRVIAALARHLEVPDGDPP